MRFAKEFEFWRRQLREGARKAKPHGHRDEEAFPIRPPGAVTIDLRDNAVMADHSNDDVDGIDTFAP